MNSFSFDITSCKEVIGDSYVREIEKKAREDADKDRYDFSFTYLGISYWDSILYIMREIIYSTQFKRRMERNKRKLNHNQPKLKEEHFSNGLEI